MITYENIENCPVCLGGGIENLKTIKYRESIYGEETEYSQKIVRCKKCGFVFVKNPFSASFLEEWYKDLSQYSEDFYFKYESLGNWTKKRFQIQKDFIDRNMDEKVNNVVEIGAATGYNLSLFQQDMELFAIEPSKRSCKILKDKYGIGYYNGTFDEWYGDKANIRMFDLVICSGMLEHITNPRDFIKKVHTITNKYLNIVVPTFNKRQEDGLLGVFVDEHINYFTIHTLSVLMNSCGFELVNWEQDLENKRNWGSPIMSLWKKANQPELADIDEDVVNNDNKMVDSYFINDEIKFESIKKKLDCIDQHTKIGLLNARGHAAKKLFAAYDFEKKNIVKVYDDDNARYGDMVLGHKVEPFHMEHIENGVVDILIICNSFSQEWIYEDYCKLGIADKVICLFSGNCSEPPIRK